MDMRIDPLTRAVTVINPARQSRPNLPADRCPFCPGGLEAPDPYDVQWFPNRWPAMPDNRCEVVLYSPHHDGGFGSFTVSQARRVVELWRERTEALGARDDVQYVLVFENRGAEVGATIAHPHGQIYAYPSVPPVPEGELSSDGCVLCSPPASDLGVAAAGGWRASVPGAAVWPYEVLLAPILHVGALTDPDCETEGLATILIDVVGRLDRLFDQPMPYMLWIHQRPTDGQAWPNAHLHVHVAPTLRERGTLRHVAAAEIGGGISFNPVEPIAAAQRLRSLVEQR